jgi:hypothetical protein
MTERRRFSNFQAMKAAYRVYQGANTLATAKQKLDTDHRWRWLFVIAIFGIGAIIVLTVAVIEISFWIALFSH